MRHVNNTSKWSTMRKSTRWRIRTRTAVLWKTPLTAHSSNWALILSMPSRTVLWKFLSEELSHQNHSSTISTWVKTIHLLWRKVVLLSARDRAKRTLRMVLARTFALLSSHSWATPMKTHLLRRRKRLQMEVVQWNQVHLRREHNQETLWVLILDNLTIAVVLSSSNSRSHPKRVNSSNLLILSLLPRITYSFRMIHARTFLTAESSSRSSLELSSNRWPEIFQLISVLFSNLMPLPWTLATSSPEKCLDPLSSLPTSLLRTRCSSCALTQNPRIILLRESLLMKVRQNLILCLSLRKNFWANKKFAILKRITNAGLWRILTVRSLRRAYVLEWTLTRLWRSLWSLRHLCRYRLTWFHTSKYTMCLIRWKRELLRSIFNRVRTVKCQAWSLRKRVSSSQIRLTTSFWLVSSWITRSSAWKKSMITMLSPLSSHS